MKVIFSLFCFLLIQSSFAAPVSPNTAVSGDQKPSSDAVIVSENSKPRSQPQPAPKLGGQKGLAADEHLRSEPKVDPKQNQLESDLIKPGSQQPITSQVNQRQSEPELAVNPQPEEKKISSEAVRQVVPLRQQEPVVLPVVQPLAQTVVHPAEPAAAIPVEIPKAIEEPKKVDQVVQSAAAQSAEAVKPSEPLPVEIPVKNIPDVAQVSDVKPVEPVPAAAEPVVSSYSAGSLLQEKKEEKKEQVTEVKSEPQVQPVVEAVSNEQKDVQVKQVSEKKEEKVVEKKEPEQKQPELNAPRVIEAAREEQPKEEKKPVIEEKKAEPKPVKESSLKKKSDVVKDNQKPQTKSN